MDIDEGPVIVEAARFATMDRCRTGYIPDSHTTEVLLAHALRLDDLDSKINAQIAAPQARLGAIRRQSAITKSLLAPVRRLPQEILSDIFLLALPTDYHHHPAGRTPLNIAEVCYTWRETALGTAALWANLNIRPSSAQEALQWVDVANRYLFRSRQVSLRISIDASNFDREIGKAAEDTNIWSYIASQTHRLHSLSLSRVPIGQYSVFEDKHFPLLRKLMLSFRAPRADNWESILAGPLPFHTFKHAPHVQTLHLWYCAEPSNLVLPSSWRITRLKIVCGDSIGAFQPDIAPCVQAVLSRAPSLEHCTLEADIFDDVAVMLSQQQRTFFPALKRLHLSRAAIHFCHFISAPEIESVVLTGKYHDDDGVLFSAFTEMVQHSSFCARLQRLDLRMFPDIGDDIDDCLMLLPSITTLALRNPAYYIPETDAVVISEGILQLLTRDEADADSLRLLPHLSRLRLQFGSSPDFHVDLTDVDSALWLMARSRSKKGLMLDGSELAVLQVQVDAQCYLPPAGIVQSGQYPDCIHYDEGLDPKVRHTEWDSEEIDSD
ncbi:uncharacterized protein SCHCODRAFT_02493119 [Schizophyllum commune H4-8]|nr:uncharacterized protein SCHCODRAFT_02493119 [Schizophyllum commune H4-8]KAI5896755.1 hypothetical protein SCHCODRAFT_02493119 [Schizophyllum commune H4-8]